MDQQGLRTQSSRASKVYCKSWGEKLWSGLELEQWVLCGEEGVGFERLLEVECLNFTTWWPCGLKEERERMECNFCVSSFGNYYVPFYWALPSNDNSTNGCRCLFCWSQYEAEAWIPKKSCFRGVPALFMVWFTYILCTYFSHISNKCPEHVQT